MGFLKCLFTSSKRLRAELAESKRQEARAWKAYFLMVDVIDNYGPEIFRRVNGF